MNIRMSLESEVHTYLKKFPDIKIREQLIGNLGGNLYHIIFKDNTEKSFFAVTIPKKKTNLNTVYDKLFQKGKSDSDYILCESTDKKETDKATYLFIWMEKITPLIQLVLDEQYGIELSENRKKEKLLNNIYETVKQIQKVQKDIPALNLFINNEEVCIDENGKAKLLLFDMVQNEISSDSQLLELKQWIRYVETGLDCKIRLDIRKKDITEFISEIKKKRQDLQEQIIEEENKFEKYRGLAKEGMTYAFARLGYFYEKGQGVAKDYKKAVYWYQMGVNQKEVTAYNNLAYMYQKGYGVTKDETMAARLLTYAANKKNDKAQLNLAIAYKKGIGVKVDMEKALYWCRQSMKNGNKTAKQLYQKLKNR